jgi:hypothetical protein
MVLFIILNLQLCPHNNEQMNFTNWFFGNLYLHSMSFLYNLLNNMMLCEFHPFLISHTSMHLVFFSKQDGHRSINLTLEPEFARGLLSSDLSRDLVLHSKGGSCTS